MKQIKKRAVAALVLVRPARIKATAAFLALQFLVMMETYPGSIST
ncbi:hypothetical protein NQU17_02765 [Clostridiaceae bacterium HFYG-1003]|nr:hypothetical protein NQU17_02765 [Clostridiaceae bacterium HFYG-1003]